MANPSHITPEAQDMINRLAQEYRMSLLRGAVNSCRARGGTMIDTPDVWGADTEHQATTRRASIALFAASILLPIGLAKAMQDPLIGDYCPIMALLAGVGALVLFFQRRK